MPNVNTEHYRKQYYGFCLIMTVQPRSGGTQIPLFVLIAINMATDGKIPMVTVGHPLPT